jgi:hypothetical protein
MATPNIAKLSVSDEDEDLWASPSKKSTKPEPSKAQDPVVRSSQSRHNESRYSEEEAREEALQKELRSVRNINQVIEGVIESLDRAKDNMEVICVNSFLHFYAD